MTDKTLDWTRLRGLGPQSGRVQAPQSFLSGKPSLSDKAFVCTGPVGQPTYSGLGILPQAYLSTMFYPPAQRLPALLACL